MDTNIHATTACPHCGHGNDRDAKFCNQCGRQIGAPSCPSCGAENPPGSRFCNNCGHLLPDTPITNAPQPEPVPGPAAQAGPAQAETPLGPRQEAACPRCQQRNEADSLYCYNCGLPLRGEPGFAGGPSRAPLGIPAFTLGRPGGFWVRLVAYLIDSIVMLAVFAILGPLLLDLGLAQYFQEYGASERVLTNGDTLLTVLWTVYSTLAVAIFATTIGKRALGMDVLRVDGRKASFARSLGRALAQILSGLLLGAGYLIIAFRSDKRGLHDLIAGTVVIRRR